MKTTNTQDGQSVQCSHHTVPVWYKRIYWNTKILWQRIKYTFVEPEWYEEVQFFTSIPVEPVEQSSQATKLSSSNGRTTGFEPENGGSIPSPSTNKESSPSELRKAKYRNKPKYNRL